LSELLSERRGPAFALECIRRIAPLLATLADASGTYAHGALTLDRIVASRDGRLVIVEHPLGAGIEALGWPVARLRSELKLLLPDSGTPVELDSRIDPIQLGLLALSVLLGRRIDASEYPANVSKLLDESTDAKNDERLRAWISRALQVGPRPLETARDVFLSLGELATDKNFRRQEPPPAVEPPPSLKPVAVSPQVSPMNPAAVNSRPAPAQPTPTPPIATAAPAAKVSAPVMPAVDHPQPAPAPAPAAAKSAASRRTTTRTWKSWVLPAIVVLAMAQAAVIAGLWYYKPRTVIVETPPAPSPAAPIAPTPSAIADPLPAPKTAAPVEPPKPAPVAAAEPVRHDPAPPAPPVATPAPPKVTVSSAAAATGAQRFGGMTFTSSIELQVFEGGKRIGVSGTPIATTDGLHSVELVNEPLGYRVQQTISVKAGEMSSRAVPVPNGRVSINAVPWAEVWIDGSPAGQTPLANVSIPIGEHQITFRHPQLGEQRQTAVVKADGVTRLSARMQQ
jgi:hypothetical protein